MVGTLPTLERNDLCQRNMTESNRYTALTDEWCKSRQGEPAHIHICCEDLVQEEKELKNGQNRSPSKQERLDFDHPDLILEACHCALQMHWRLPCRNTASYFNVALFITPVMVVVACNSSFLFGEKLWQESRIPMFEQAVRYGGDAAPPRVWLGNGFIRQAPLEDRIPTFAIGAHSHRHGCKLCLLLWHCPVSCNTPCRRVRTCQF
jgi:hypothetical protein